MNDERQYLAYMVRLWAVHRNSDVLWRASVENAHTGERLAFEDMESLCRYMNAKVAEVSAAPQSESNRKAS